LLWLILHVIFLHLSGAWNPLLFFLGLHMESPTLGQGGIVQGNNSWFSSSTAVIVVAAAGAN